MSILLELPPHIESLLRQQAESKKLSVDGYIVDLIEQDRREAPVVREIDAMIHRTPA